MTVRPGDRLPNIALTATTGESVDLASLRGELTLIVFLRHLG